MEELIQLIMKTYGLVGLLLLAPFVAAVYLYRHNLSLQRAYVAVQEQRVKDAETHNEKMAKVYEQRVTDAQTISQKLMTLMEEQAALNSETNTALDQVRDVMSKISAQKKF